MSERPDYLRLIAEALVGLARDTYEVDALASEISVSLRAGNTLYLAGAGRLSMASRLMAAEYVSRHGSTRSRGLAAIALTGDPATQETVESDFGPDHAQGRMLEAIAAHGDLLLLLTEDGGEEALRNAARVARQAGVVVVGIALAGPGDMFEPGETVVDLGCGGAGDGLAVLLAVHSHIISGVEEALGVLD